MYHLSHSPARVDVELQREETGFPSIEAVREAEECVATLASCCKNRMLVRELFSPSAGHGLGYWHSSVPASLQRWAKFNRCSTLSEDVESRHKEVQLGGHIMYFCKSQLTTLKGSISSHL